MFIISWLFALVTIPSLLILLPQTTWFLEVNSNLSLYYLAFHMTAIFLVIICKLQEVSSPDFLFKFRMRTIAVISLVMIAIYSYPLIPFLTPNTSNPNNANSSNSISTLFANVLRLNPDVRPLKTYISQHSPDIIGAVEVSPEWISGIDLAKDYPYNINEARNHYFGLALFSKFPLERCVSPSEKDGTPETIVTKVKIDQRSFVIGVLHAIPPQAVGFERNLKLIENFQKSLDKCGEDQIVLTDLNATLYSRFYKSFQNKGFKSAQEGYGLERTWNAFSYIFRFTLDHIFVNESMRVRSFEVGPGIGSDHFPLFAEIVYSDTNNLDLTSLTPEVDLAT